MVTYKKNSLRGASKSPNNVASTFCSAAHLLPKDFRFDHGAPNFSPWVLSHLVALLDISELQAHHRMAPEL